MRKGIFKSDRGPKGSDMRPAAALALRAPHQAELAFGPRSDLKIPFLIGIKRSFLTGLTTFWVLLAGCASGEPYMMPDSTDSSRARPEALGNDIFYRKPMQDHRNDKKWEFFYKHCSLDDDGLPFIPKRAFACSDAY